MALAKVLQMLVLAAFVSTITAQFGGLVFGDLGFGLGGKPFGKPGFGGLGGDKPGLAGLSGGKPGKPGSLLGGFGGLGDLYRFNGPEDTGVPYYN